MNYTAIIIDDEIRARQLLKGILDEFAPHIHVVADCDDLPTGVKSIRKLKPNLVFLDIEMPGHSGLELLDFFNEDEIDFDIIFTTAYNQYAIKAFKLSAIDYILKPIETDELLNAISRFEKSKKPTALNLHVLKDNLQNRNLNSIAVPTGNSIRFVELNNIVYLKADNSYSEIFFADGKKLIVSRTLKNFEEVLDANSNFFRCHKSYLVNTTYIVDYVKSDGGYLVLKEGTQIPISGDKSNELLEMMKMIKR